MPRICKCPHLDNVLQLSLSELCKLKQGIPCTQCDVSGPNLWICLYKNCFHIGCSENFKDHSTIHFEQNPGHCIHMNQSSQRIWCYMCEMEVFLTTIGNMSKSRRMTIDDEATNSSDMSRYVESILAYERTAAAAAAADATSTITADNNNESYDSSADDDCDNEMTNYSNAGGLVGLQNIANTCYMNAALQALSNTPPLTGYFLECGDIIEANSELAAPNSSQRKTGLAKSYYRLVKDIWLRHKRTNGYIVPNGILYGIRNVHPMFRGFQQHDTQEFLRCFMDQLHEELKEMTPPPPELLKLSTADNLIGRTDNGPYLNSLPMSPSPTNHSMDESSPVTDEERSQCSTPSLSLSEAEYETCDSGVSEQSSLSDEASCSTRTLPKFIHSTASVGSVTTTNTTLSMSMPINCGLQTQSMSSSYSRSSSPTSSAPLSLASHQFGSSPELTRIAFELARGKLSASADQHQHQQQQQQKQSSNGSASATSAKSPPHRSIISDVFDGKLLSSVQCLTCDRVSTREETFQDLSLPIPGKDHLNVLHQSQGIMAPLSSSASASGLNSMNCSDAVYHGSQDGWFWWIWNWMRSFFWGPAVTLHDCMSAFFSADELKGDNMYSCEKCHKLRNGIKFSRVLALPEMLCVHLKRFRHDLSYSSKISSPVHFPLVGLDMRPYLHKDCKSKVSTYDLTAVICHHGTVGGGHYTSFAKHELTGKWFEFDDQLVTEVSAEMVQNCEAYVLFYRKSNPQMAIVRSQAMQLNAERASDIRFYVSRQWLNKFKTFAEPGPIDNWTLLCPHGGLSPRKYSTKSLLVEELPQPLWEFLFKKFGGGPACNLLIECDICREAADALTRRQNYELDAFSAYKDETTATIYAISMAWFRQWQLFVGAVTDENPGPINNKTIASQTDNPVSRGVKPGADYAQINSTLWKFFYNIYGGGPEIILRGNPPDEFRSVNVPASSSINKDERHTAAGAGNDYNNSVPMQLDHQPASTSNTTTTTTTTTTITADIEKPTNQIASGPANGPATSTQPVHTERKNVSFEDDKDIDKETPSDQYSSSMRRSSKHQPHSMSNHSAPSEIVSRKDRRHRSGIKTNGLFGAEGKYSDFKNIPDDNSNALKNNGDGGSGGGSGGGDTMMNSDANKRLDEITPLLHQASISATTHEPMMTTTTTTSSKAHHYHNHHHHNNSAVYRKRFKTKSGRKAAAYSVSESNLSDSDRN